MNISNIHDHTFYQVDVYKNGLYGSESPARYGRKPDEFISLYKRNNITHVISLDDEGLENIEISCKEHGVDHQSRLIEDFKIYKKSYDGYFLPLLKEVQKIMLDPKNKIVFHCRAGHGRTGTVLSALKIFEIVNFKRKKEDLKLLIDNNSGELLKNNQILPSKENTPYQVSKIVQEAINVIRTSKNGGNKGAVESGKDIETLNLWAYRIIFTKLNE